MKITEQIILWRYGIPVHNIERNECCPDFSCCQPALLASEDERAAFCRLNDEGQMAMLFGFLSKGLAEAAPEKSIYIAGDVERPER